MNELKKSHFPKQIEMALLRILFKNLSKKLHSIELELKVFASPNEKKKSEKNIPIFANIRELHVKKNYV